MSTFLQQIEKCFPDCSAEQQAAFSKYLEHLYRTNEFMNLTRVPVETAVERHLVDSAAILPEIDGARANSILDVGTGAGLPGILLAIMRPQLKITMVESIKKKATFVKETVAMLGLVNTHIVSERAEDLAKNPAFAKQFDIVTARAVASVKELVQWCFPFLKPEGILVFPKGPKLPSELEEASKLLVSKALKTSSRPYSLNGESLAILSIRRAKQA